MSVPTLTSAHENRTSQPLLQDRPQPITDDASWLLSLRSLPVRVVTRVHGLTQAHEGPSEDGMSTAEYAVGTVAAAGFAGVLYKVITSGAVLELMRGIIARALKVAF